MGCTLGTKSDEKPGPGEAPDDAYRKTTAGKTQAESADSGISESAKENSLTPVGEKRSDLKDIPWIDDDLTKPETKTSEPEIPKTEEPAKGDIPQTAVEESVVKAEVKPQESVPLKSEQEVETSPVDSSAGVVVTDAVSDVQTDSKPQEITETSQPEAPSQPEGGTDPASQGAQVEDRFYNNQAFQKPDVDTSDPQQNDAALKIQTKYRQFHAKKVVQAKREEVAAVKIQSGYRGFQDRQKVKELKSEEGEVAVAGEPDIDLDDPEVQDAATKIQAQFKGYQARKEVQAMKEAEQEAGETQGMTTDIDLEDPEVAAAASKIQASFKGYQTRKDIESQGEANEDPAADQSEQPESTEQQDSQAEPQETEEPVGVQNEEEIKEKPAEPEAESAPVETQIDDNDPEANAAAVKIQAGFKGMKARQEVKAMREQREQEIQEGQDVSGEGENKPTDDNENAEQNNEQSGLETNDEEKEKAAIKIQATFKGYQTRKEISAKRQASQQGADPPTEQTEATEVVEQGQE